MVSRSRFTSSFAVLGAAVLGAASPGCSTGAPEAADGSPKASASAQAGTLQMRGADRARVVDDATTAYPIATDPTTWTGPQEFVAPGGAPCAVAASGGVVVIGNCGQTVGANFYQGAAYVFVQSGSSWTLQATLTAGDGAEDDAFGSAVSVSSGIAVIGAPNHTVGTGYEQGAAYVFVQSGSSWSQQAELAATDGQSGDDFGSSLSLSGESVLIGAPNRTDDTYRVGVAYIFSQSGANWTQTAELSASNGKPMNNMFGNSVSLSGSTALIGAYGYSSKAGAAYVFVQSGSTWTQQAALSGSDSHAYDYFGSSVALVGGTAVIGAPQHEVGSNELQGAAYLFVQNGAKWSQEAEFTASDGAAQDQFGQSVGLSSLGAVLVGAPCHTTGSNAYQGAAYVFTPEGATWSQQELTPSDGVANGEFGDVLTVNGAEAVVGGGTADGGAVYVYDAPSQSSSGGAGGAGGAGGSSVTGSSSSSSGAGGGTTDAGCSCSGTGIDGPVTIACGQTTCGSDSNTYACSASGWSFSASGCSAPADAGCSCSGTGIDGPVTIACGQTTCGSDSNTYACSASGWSFSASGC